VVKPQSLHINTPFIFKNCINIYFGVRSALGGLPRNLRNKLVLSLDWVDYLLYLNEGMFSVFSIGWAARGVGRPHVQAGLIPTSPLLYTTYICVVLGCGLGPPKVVCTPL